MPTITGASTSGLLSPADRWSKATVHPVWRNRVTGKFSAILPTGTAWSLWPDLATPGTSVATGKANQSLRPTVVTHATGYYVIWASTTLSTFQAYDWTDTMVGAAVDLPFSIVNHDQSPVTAVIDTLGQIWVAWGQTGVVNVIRSTDSGLTWTGPTQIGTFGSSQSGVIGLTQSGTFMQSLSNGNDSSGRSAKRIAISATNLAQANWTVETLPAFASGASSDDHLGITSTPDGTVYAVAKTTNGATDVQLIYLLVRTPAGVWSSYNIEVGPDDDGGATPGYSRPNVFIIGQTLHAVYGSIYAPNNLSHKTMDLATPGTFTARAVMIAGPDFSDGAVVPAFEEIMNPPDNLPLLAHDRDADTIEYVFLAIPAADGTVTWLGINPIQTAYLGTLDATKAYLGSALVRG